jgi:hypothetical protein
MPQDRRAGGQLSGIGVSVAIFLLVAFIGGVVLGLVVIVSVSSRREDRLYSLTGEAPDAVCRGARRLMGARDLRRLTGRGSQAGR